MDELHDDECRRFQDAAADLSFIQVLRDQNGQLTEIHLMITIQRELLRQTRSRKKGTGMTLIGRKQLQQLRRDKRICA